MSLGVKAQQNAAIPTLSNCTVLRKTFKSSQIAIRLSHTLQEICGCKVFCILHVKTNLHLWGGLSRPFESQISYNYGIKC